MKINLKTKWGEWQNRHRISRVASQVEKWENTNGDPSPIVFFNVSSRISGISLNAAFSLLTGWSLRLAGTPVINYACHAGMSHCVLGTNREDYKSPPPCDSCITQSIRLFTGSKTEWFKYGQNGELAEALSNLTVEQMAEFEYPFHRSAETQATDSGQPLIPLGRMVLPSIRWALRCHSLPDDAETRYLMREYMLSAFSTATSFYSFLKEIQPRVVIIFNGIMYPEAAARWVANLLGLRVITHEVGFQPNSAFFSEAEAPAYPIYIPTDFELNDQQNQRLDEYLKNRFQGDFTMAGIRFWPEMHHLDQSILAKIKQFNQSVPVFTNVVYDTSQIYAHRIYPQMFTWLEVVLETIRDHPETLFIIRAHPDEMRTGTAKLSRESVHDWVKSNQVERLDNVLFIDSTEYASSYELIQLAKFVMVYNSSIGLEASLLGAAVLCAGKARYTRYPTVFTPATHAEYKETLEKFLTESEIEVPPEHQQFARKFLYYQLFRASLPFDEYVGAGQRMGYIYLKPFNWKALTLNESNTMRILHQGITNNLTSEGQKNRQEIFLLPQTT